MLVCIERLLGTVVVPIIVEGVVLMILMGVEKIYGCGITTRGCAITTPVTGMLSFSSESPLGTIFLDISCCC